MKSVGYAYVSLNYTRSLSNGILETVHIFLGCPLIFLKSKKGYTKSTIRNQRLHHGRTSAAAPDGRKFGASIV
jgi:hypothetical protein